jgi:uncharacterized membrane protein
MENNKNMKRLNIQILLYTLIVFFATNTTSAMSYSMPKDSIHFQRDSINYESGTEIKKFVNNIVAGGVIETVGTIVMLANFGSKSTLTGQDNSGQTAGFIIVLVGVVILLSAFAHLFKAGQLMQSFGNKRKKKKR